MLTVPIAVPARRADAARCPGAAGRWLSILEASFLVRLLRPYHANFGKRLIKSPKIYFLDTGLLCYLLRIQSPEDLRLHASRGPIFESFIISELLQPANALWTVNPVAHPLLKACGKPGVPAASGAITSGR